jgi:hypothetical protein
MSLQTELNKIVAFMRKQGRPAFNSNTESCLYRGPDGTMCAVGCRITDDQVERYDLQGSMAGVDQLPSALLDELATATEVPVENLRVFYRRMQRAHDNAAFDWSGKHVKNWLAAFEASARVVAEDFGLTYPEPA